MKKNEKLEKERRLKKEDEKKSKKEKKMRRDLGLGNKRWLVLTRVRPKMVKNK